MINFFRNRKKRIEEKKKKKICDDLHKTLLYVGYEEGDFHINYNTCKWSESEEYYHKNTIVKEYKKAAMFE